jgi:hypothetical protein
VRRVLSAAAVVVAGTAIPSVALAIEVEDVGGETLTIDVTNTAVGGYSFDNRDDNADIAPPPPTIVNDTFGELLDRLNVQFYYWRLRAGVRIDFATYFGQLSERDITEIAAERLPDGTGPERNDYVNAFLRELNTRYRTTLYPSKLFFGYTDAGVDITVGDFYANFGRGLVLSVRKIDELATDTTIRGLKAAFKKSWEDAALSVTGLAGQMNPIRIDEQSGRRLNGHGSPLFFGFPSSNDFVYYTFDQFGHTGYVVERARPSYLEDSLFGLSVEAGPHQVLIGAHATVLQRESFGEANVRCNAAGAENCDALFPTFSTTNPARLRDLIVTASGSVKVPNFWDHGDAYVEVAAQHLTDGRPTSVEADGSVKREGDLTGYAVYLGGTARAGPIAVNVEGKHYRSFFPLAGNINASAAADPTFSAPEFDTVAYNQPPTAEPIYTQQFGSPNICVTGGRIKGDYQLAEKILAYAWVGYYTSFTEVDAQNFGCDADDPTQQTNTWDAASGGEMELEGGKSYVKAWVGIRDTAHAEPATVANLAAPSDVFYREGYVRYDMAKHLAGDFTLQAQGVHRHRYEPQLAADSWNEGENYLALRWAPYMTFIFGYEYLGRRGCQPDDTVELCHYFSGGVQFKAADREHVVEQVFDTVNLFVGQRRGAIRCVSGVCRNFPPYEGAKLELTSRF